MKSHITIWQALLQDLVKIGAIKARTKWKEIYPLFRDDERYLSMLGNPGSNPIELFWDIVDGMDQQLDAKIAAVEDVFKKANVTESEKTKSSPDADSKMADAQAPNSPFVTAETTWDDFMTVINAHADSNVKSLSEDDLKNVFKTVSLTPTTIYCLKKQSCIVARRCLQSSSR